MIIRIFKNRIKYYEERIDSPAYLIILSELFKVNTSIFNNFLIVIRRKKNFYVIFINKQNIFSITEKKKKP